MRALATFFGAGLLRPGPGTWGSLAAMVVAWPILWLGGPVLLVAATLGVVAIGLPAIRAEVAASGAEDPSHVVIDEVAGMWIALMPVGFGAWHVGAPLLALWPGWIAAFALFRLFDIWKPGPVGWADRRGDGWGVMGDDLIAGAFAALGVVLLAALAHGVLMT
ncbi:phosphatidylglycerophosphatase A family protein [Wenxinia saemankumensis]|uniref:Phosphatidylglycerophosphatase A n=1 Tax=Wenxinia saemankumensis TaxID=1447782 RepID=A0A1M6A754_9RHOB|nr:phosphatidylglycerophosphatase A [Wenxinia saemankumensis]SHI32328.1 phosphatidylglycerophosphatase A [Wenxinia saemankumensis]